MDDTIEKIFASNYTTQQHFIKLPYQVPFSAKFLTVFLQLLGFKYLLRTLIPWVLAFSPTNS
jgi:hypothetical protein